MEYYLEVLAIPPHMERYDDGMCAWIKPKEGKLGPACVYKVMFQGKTDEEIHEKIRIYREKGAPDVWLLTPLSAPLHIRKILAEEGLVEPEPPAVSDLGMALLPEQMNDVWKNVACTSDIVVKRVNHPEEFVTWTDIVNPILHGCQLIAPESYYPLCESGKMVCYMGYDGNKPVTTLAAMNHEGNATLEFISTLPEHRKKGIATEICRAAIRQLANDGVYMISLRAFPMGVSLYESLGFRSYLSL